MGGHAVFDVPAQESRRLLGRASSPAAHLRMLPGLVQFSLNLRGNSFEHAEINKRCPSCLLENSRNLLSSPCSEARKPALPSAFSGVVFWRSGEVSDLFRESDVPLCLVCLFS